VTSTQAGSTALAPAWAGGASTMPTGPLISPLWGAAGPLSSGAGGSGAPSGGP
jgi:hypothetical protein